jgi:hypothetical protein
MSLSVASAVTTGTTRTSPLGSRCSSKQASPSRRGRVHGRHIVAGERRGLRIGAHKAQGALIFARGLTLGGCDRVHGGVRPRVACRASQRLMAARRSSATRAYAGRNSNRRSASRAPRSSGPGGRAWPRGSPGTCSPIASSRSSGPAGTGSPSSATAPAPSSTAARTCF